MLLHLTCRRLLAERVPRHLAATALTLYGRWPTGSTSIRSGSCSLRVFMAAGRPFPFGVDPRPRPHARRPTGSGTLSHRPRIASWTFS